MASRKQQQQGETGWTAVPNWVLLHPDLGRVDIMVYLALAYRADNKERTCWPSHRQIMADARLGANKRPLITSLRRLEEVGAICVSKRTGYANLYYLPKSEPRPDGTLGGGVAD